MSCFHSSALSNVNCLENDGGFKKMHTQIWTVHSGKNSQKMAHKKITFFKKMVPNKLQFFEFWRQKYNFQKNLAPKKKLKNF